ncbi:uncharacterized protein BDR25DRAFT_335171 [Lindgomyces ingoldianus]|uniref:Uncharacterized protein n=1 Tax=Lindgomyces ingoldianus TaxID=673940 RepID=A0ACB6QQD5_9PLEO|nr:uncharacterized protein BDR25DRAFT_335171 [Lindgomyces ingoldianus]KAF2468745.1 hypothetical protein BDR25DRAFT_335171 [Lindgomyces ingoldianus]
MSESLKIAKNRLSAVASTLTGGLVGPSHQLPAFDDLPKVLGQPQGCIWGVFDKDGKKDEVGTLNLLTPSVVQAASREIQSGEHVQLDWPLNNVQFPGFGRKEFNQTMIDLKPSLGFAAMDDEVYINTQSGSQWDSLKHFAHQATGKYYNGLTHEEATKTITNGIHNWCERGGIVGRGVLVDWLRWYENKHGNPPSPVSRYAIPVEELEETLKWQGTTTRPGDIMMIRSGYVRWHDNASAAERKSGTQENSLYDHHFAAVAGDTVAFEAWPPSLEDGWCLHEWLLVQWGTPIGEMWNLEKLSKICEQKGRWTFFLTSAPLHIMGGIGSPPGAIAVF